MASTRTVFVRRGIMYYRRLPSTVFRLVLILCLSSLGSAAPTADAQLVTCIGDCNGDGVVTIDELIYGVDLALQGGEGCPALECNLPNTLVDVSCLILGVNNALTGCPPPETTQGACCLGDCPGENCSTTMDQAACCVYAQTSDIALNIGWCPPDEFDPSTHQCSGCTEACVGLPLASPTPTGTPTPSGR